MDTDDAPAVAGNRRLTSLAGVTLIPLLVLVYLTGLVMDALWHLHYVVGFVLIPVVAAKMGSTAYRALRYYTGSRDYRAAGPPDLALRLLAPLLIVSIVVTLATGVILFAERSRTGTWASLHTDASVVTVFLGGVHLLAYFDRALRHAAAEFRGPRVRGMRLRLALVVAALAAGAVIAAATYSAGVWPARPRGVPPIRDQGGALPSTRTSQL